MTGIRVVSDNGAGIVRARDIGVAGLDHDGGIRRTAGPRPGAQAEPGPAGRSPFFPAVTVTFRAIAGEADCARNVLVQR